VEAVTQQQVDTRIGIADDAACLQAHVSPVAAADARAAGKPARGIGSYPLRPPLA
jgi:hypothetical protein